MNEGLYSDDERFANSEIQEACREVLGLEKEKTVLTIAEFYAATPDVLGRSTGQYCICVKMMYLFFLLKYVQEQKLNYVLIRNYHFNKYAFQ